MSAEKPPVVPVAVVMTPVLAYVVGGTTGVVVAAVFAGVVYVQRGRLERLTRRGGGLEVLFRRVQGWSRRHVSNEREAGASSFARARALRTPWVRLLTAVGISTRAERLASKCVAGGKGEREAARLLRPLLAEGWVFLYDRRIPGANVDIVGISARGIVYNLDAKLWSAQARYRLRVADGRLMRGQRDITDWLDGVLYETRTINRLLSVEALTVLLMVGDTLAPGERLHVAGVRMVAAAEACDYLRALDREQIPRQRGPQFIALAARRLPSYTGK